MVNLNEMSINEIRQEIDLLLKDRDLLYFCDDYKIISEFAEKIKSKNLNKKQKMDFYIKHEDKIDKEKLLLMVIMNYREDISSLDEKINELNKMLPVYKNDTDFKMYTNLLNYIMDLKETKKERERGLKRALKLGENIKKNVIRYVFNSEKRIYELDIIDPREVIKGKKHSEKENLKRLKKIDQTLKKFDNEKSESESNEELQGIEILLQSIVLSDYCEIFPDQIFGLHIRSVLLDNQILK